jgi:FADH2 O2-dependent halogenase
MNADVVILGSGFAGSLLAMILARHGLRVVILDRDRHPRFAIGESSTPIADLTLARLAARHDLPEVAPLARWGTWRHAYPEIGCGLKRGFSYFRHVPGELFADTPDHAASLLVAASATDADADTHWLRADVDALLFRQALVRGAIGREGCTITAVEREAAGWRVAWTNERGAAELATSPFLVDATGTGGLLGGALRLGRLDDVLSNRTGAIFTHLAGVASWDAEREEAGDASTTTPFRSDDAAQHHVLRGGWMWMLRFAGDRCSVGIVAADVGFGDVADPDGSWRRRLAPYPSLVRLLAAARPLRPFATIPRLSRLWERASGPGWAFLPTTAGFIDPLHSTGIAHSLQGVARVADMLLAPRFDEAAWLAYGRDVVDEVRWIDRLVATATAAIDDFPLFTMACHLYFVATIACERGVDGLDADVGFLAARDAPLRAALESACADLGRAASDPSMRDATCAAIRDRLEPWDRAGLFNRDARNRFAHTAAPKEAAVTVAGP